MPPAFLRHLMHLNQSPADRVYAYGFGELTYLHMRPGYTTFLRATKLIEQFWRERTGSVAIMLGVALPVVIGMAALGTEIAFSLVKYRQLQIVADAAAVDAATAVQKGYPNFAVEAQAVAASLGAQNGVNGVTVTANSPPSSGPNASKSGAVEVIISKPQALSLASLFTSGSFNIVARAVATPGAGAGCVLQLNPATSFNMSNGATATLSSCGLAVDATGSSALSMTGAAVLNAQSVSVVGKASITNGATINPSTALKTGQASVADPYAGVTMPALPGGCSNGVSTQYAHSKSVQTITPGVWCDGVSFSNDANVLLQPGVYYVNGGNFNVGGAVIMNGTGVTIILTSSIAGNYATVTINNGATVTLSCADKRHHRGDRFLRRPQSSGGKQQQLRRRRSREPHRRGVLSVPVDRVSKRRE